jgi:hypothetical protein
MLALVETVLLRSVSGKVLLRDGDGILGPHTAPPTSTTALLQRSARGCVTGFSTTALCSVRSTEVVGLPCAS